MRCIFLASFQRVPRSGSAGQEPVKVRRDKNFTMWGIARGPQKPAIASGFASPNDGACR
jgi:hypothetical protein